MSLTLCTCALGEGGCVQVGDVQRRDARKQSCFYFFPVDVKKKKKRVKGRFTRCRDRVCVCVLCVFIYIYENESVRKEVVSALLIYMCKWIEKKKRNGNKQTNKKAVVAN